MCCPHCLFLPTRTLPSFHEPSRQFPGASLKWLQPVVPALPHPWQISDLWKTLINPLLLQAGHSAGAPLLCFRRCSRDTCFSPPTLQELAPVRVLGNPVEASASCGREETGRPCFSTCFIPPGNPHFLHSPLEM